MKRIISLVLVLVSLLTLSVFCFTGCGAVNRSEVSILWSGDGEAKVPDSLINSMERAMYIKNVSYKHYGANGDLSKQVEQAKTAVNSGCAVLLVELVQDNLLEAAVAQKYAQDIVDAAKAKGTPVVFFNCVVADTVINSYDKCVLVKADTDTAAEVQAQIIADYVKKNFNAFDTFNEKVKGTDKNKDNKITALSYGLNGLYNKEVVDEANKLLATDDYKVSRDSLANLDFFGLLENWGLVKYFHLTVELSEDIYTSADLTNYELIITDSDASAFDALLNLQAKEFNTEKLKEQFVPIVTVGNTKDYKAHVLSGRGEISNELLKEEGDSSFVISEKNSKIRELFKDYYYENRFICDLTAVDEYDDMAEMIYTTINVVGDGRIVGTSLSDNDAISIAVATITRNFIKGNDPLKDVAKQEKDKPATVIVEGSVAKVRYTSVTVE